MGEIVEFPSNGSTAQGYLAAPESGRRHPGRRHPGVVGPRAPHRGRVRPLRRRGLRRPGARPVPRREHDRARRGRQAHDGAEHRAGGQGHVRRRRQGWQRGGAAATRVGVTGFCMGGGLALVLASPASRRDQGLRAVVRADPVWPGAEPDWSKLDAAVLGHYAEHDGFFTPELAEQMRKELREAGLEARDPRPSRRRPRLLQRHAARGATTPTRGRRRGGRRSTSSARSSVEHASWRR